MSVKQVFNTSAELDYPTVLPTLDLDFANSKTLDPRITFTRASGGSYVGADGLIKYAGVNEARFDHDPVTGESLGLLIEESRTNLVSYSEQFDNASWIKTNIGITTNTSATTAPDGTNGAEKLSATAVNGEHLVYKTPSLTSSTYTLSVFAKAAGYNFIAVRIDGASLQRITLFDLSTGTIGSTSNVTSSSITPYSNGWYRCSITVTDAVNNYVFLIFPTNSNVSYTGDGTSGALFWGAQVEQGSFPTSYIPTVASTRTRAADNASITGKNFSSFYRQDEGTLYANARINALGGGQFPGIVYVDDGTLNNTIGFYINDVGNDFVGAEVYIANVSQYAVFSSLPVVPNQLIKAISAYRLNNFAAAFNIGSNAILTDNVGNVPTVNRLVIGRLRGGFQWLNGTISRLTYYPKRLPNSQLISLTR